eukprot:gene3409-13452_t
MSPSKIVDDQSHCEMLSKVGPDAGKIVEDRSYCELLSREDIAIQQLVLLALSEDSVVVQQACKTIGHLATFNFITAHKLISHNVMSAMDSLIKSDRQETQLCGLGMLSNLAAGSDEVNSRLLTASVLSQLQLLIKKECSVCVIQPQLLPGQQGGHTKSVRSASTSGRASTAPVRAGHKRYVETDGLESAGSLGFAATSGRASPAPVCARHKQYVETDGLESAGSLG